MAKVPPPTHFPTFKRGPSAPLSGSSSEGENSDIEDVPPSPCSSTSSGPTYVRPPGFKHHAQEVRTLKLKPSHASSSTSSGGHGSTRSCGSVKLKKKIRKHVTAAESGLLSHQNAGSSLVVDLNNNNNNNSVPSVPGYRTKPKAKKDPLPMKLRALPQSFWQQPNIVNAAAPGSMYAVLPPVSKTEQPTIFEITDVRPVSPSSDQEYRDPNRPTKSERLDREKPTSDNKPLPSQEEPEIAGKEAPAVLLSKPPKPPRRMLRVSATSTNLLAKLFDGIEKKNNKTLNTSVRSRGRPKRLPTHPNHSKHVIGDDPYMIDAIADDLHVLPLLSKESNRQSIGPSSHLSVIAVKDGDKTLTLPSLSIEQNYPAMLTELVKAL